MSGIVKGKRVTKAAPAKKLARLAGALGIKPKKRTA